MKNLSVTVIVITLLCTVISAVIALKEGREELPPECNSVSASVATTANNKNDNTDNQVFDYEILDNSYEDSKLKVKIRIKNINYPIEYVRLYYGTSTFPYKGYIKMDSDSLNEQYSEQSEDEHNSYCATILVNGQWEYMYYYFRIKDSWGNKCTSEVYEYKDGNIEKGKWNSKLLNSLPFILSLAISVLAAMIVGICKRIVE